MRNRELYRRAKYYIELFFDKELTLYAASLSYYTIFTVVPLLLVSLMVITNMPSFEEYYATIKSFIFSSLIPVHSEKIAAHLDGFLKNSVKLGSIGFIMIIVAALMFFRHYEYIVSRIFHTRVRNIWEAITTYWTLLTLMPLGLVASFYISSRIASIESINVWLNIMSLLPYLIIFSLFFLIYKIASVEGVDTHAALISAFVASLVWSLAKALFIYYVFYSKSYLTIYGSFASLLFFLLWIYVSWIIFIYGLKLCYLLDKHSKNAT